MESLTEFGSNWSWIYVYYYPIVLFYVLFTFVGGVLLVFVITKMISTETLKKQFENNSSSVIVTKKFFINFFIQFPALFILSLLLSIIPSFIRWYFNFPGVHVLYYVLFIFIFLMIVYVVFGQNIVGKYVEPSKYYFGKDWLLVIIHGNYFLIPFTALKSLSFDKTHKLIKLKFSSKLLFLRLPSVFVYYISDESMYDTLTNRLKDLSIPFKNENLLTIKSRLLHYRIHLKGEFLEKDFVKFPNKLTKLLQSL